MSLNKPVVAVIRWRIPASRHDDVDNFVQSQRSFAFSTPAGIDCCRYSDDTGLGARIVFLNELHISITPDGQLTRPNNYIWDRAYASMLNFGAIFNVTYGFALQPWQTSKTSILLFANLSRNFIVAIVQPNKNEVTDWLHMVIKVR